MSHTESRSFVFSPLVTINYEVHGAGPVALVLLHGYGASLVTWRDVLPAISARYRVYALDLKGFGLSSKPPDGDYSPQVQARIVAAFVRQMPEDGVVLGGNSYGGAVALLAYRDLTSAGAAQPIRGLILVDAAAYPQRFPWYMGIMRWPLLNRFILQATPAAWRVRSVLGLAFADRRRITRERVARHAVFLDMPGSQAAAIAVARQIPNDSQEAMELLPAIDIPTLILWGRQDRIIAVACAERLHRDIAHSRLVILENCGHVPQEELPAETSRHMLEFMDGIAR